MQNKEAYYTHLLSGFIDNSLPADRVEELLHFIREEPEVYNRLLNKEEIASLLLQHANDTTIDITDVVTERIKHRLMNTIYAIPEVSTHISSPVHRVHFLKTTWLRYAAAIMLAASVGGYVWYANQSKELVATSDNKREQTTDIVPGGNKAVLTLADGSTIMLDSASTGNLAQQGNTRIIKLSSGQLSYSAGKSLSTEVLYNTISTPRGGQYQVVLPDGSKVWLNAASSIRFPASFRDSIRNVEVRGEVYIEVVKNIKQTFVVKAKGTEIQVLGTSFNINAYGEEEVVKTTLLEGSVKMVVRDKETVLRPGEQCSLSGDRWSVVSGQSEAAIAWKNNLFSFDGADIKTIMRQIERWYDVEVEFRNGIPTGHVSGEVPRNTSLLNVLEIFKATGINVKLEGRKLIVMK